MNSEDIVEMYSMKKQLNSLLLLFIIAIVFMLAGCQQQFKGATKNFDLAVFDTSKVYTFHRDAQDLQLVESFHRPTDKSLWGESFADAGNAYVARSTDGKDLKILLDSIDKKTLKETLEPAKGNSVYTSITDGEYFYTTVVYMDRIDFHKYDLSMKEVSHASVPNEETINASNQFLFIENTLYLLVSNVVRDTGVPQTELWKMDKDFNVLDKINLDEKGALLRMVNVGQVLYIGEHFAGSDSAGERNSSNRIVVYHLDTGVKESIQLSLAFPHRIYHDVERNYLVIENKEQNRSDFPWTILDLATYEEKIVTFPEFADREYFPPFFTMHDGSYYFLFRDVLVIYDPDTNQKTMIDLKKHGITDAHTLIVNE